MQILPTHIAVDGNEANVTNRVGSNVYAFEVLTELEKCCRIDPAISVTVLLADSPQPDMPRARQGWRYQVIGPKTFWTQWALPLHLFKKQRLYDVFFTPGHYAPRLCSVPYVSSVMDTAYLEVPHQFKGKDYLQLKHWTAYSVRNAAKVVAISESTKRSVVFHYHKPAEDVVVAYPSVTPLKDSLPAKQLTEFYEEKGIAGPYFLFVGTLQPRKNLSSLIEAFEVFCKRLEFEERAVSTKRRRTKAITDEKPYLVLAGKVGWLADPILTQVETSPYKSQIRLPGFISELEKKTLIEHAEALVLLGEYEGFGIPPLEALQYGTIPLVSNSSSLPEVVGDAGITVDPRDVPSISEKLWQIFHMKAKQRGMYKRTGREQRKLFSWRTSALTILQTLITVAHPEAESILEVAS